MVVTNNEWKVSGKVFYLRELEGEFAVSLKIRGTAKRLDEVFSSQILELGCLMQKAVYEEGKRKGLGVRKEVCLSGHLETWKQTLNGKPTDKVMFIADRVLEVA